MDHNRLQMLITPNVRFGSKADMCSALGDVRFVPKADLPDGKAALNLIAAVCRKGP